MGRNVALEAEVTATGPRLADPTDAPAGELLATVKRAGFGDRELAELAGTTSDAVRAARLALGLRPGYAMVDTCAAEFAAETPYFYSTYAAAGSAPEAPPVTRPAALVIGSGPVRIGQGIEFDYCAVQAADTLRRAGWSAVMINSNPETVSTDFDASSRLYFEPLDPESVRSVIDAESTGYADGLDDSPDGVDLLPAVVAYGGQTPLNLAAPLAAGGVPLLGSTLESIDQAEERTRFLGAPRPPRDPAARGRHGALGRGGADPRRADRLSGDRPAVVRDRRARHRLLLLAGRPCPAAGGGDGRRSRPACPDRPLPSRASRSTWTPSRTGSAS